MVLDDFYASLEEGYYSLMDKLENDYHIPVYENFITPIEEQGRPSFPIFLGALIVFLILLGGSIYLLLSSTASTTLRVQVLVDGKGLSGSSVSLDYQGKKLAGITDKDGFVDFKGLKPGEDVTATASSDQYGEGSVSGKVQKGKIIKITLKSRSGNFIELSIIEESGYPVSGARIEYSSESDSGDTYSDDNGVAEIDWEGSRLDILISKSGFQQYMGSYGPSDLGDTITLQRTSPGGASPSPTISPEKAKLKIYVYDEDGQPLSSSIKTCLASTSCNSPRSYAAPGGFVQITDYGVNVQLKIIASASGYETDTKTITLAGESSVRFDLDPAGTAISNQTKHKTAISVFNNESRLPLSSLIYILDSDRQIVNATPSQTSSYDFYLVNGTYLAYAEAQAFISNGVGPFKAGENQSIYLVRATAQNSRTIRILTIDYNNAAIKTSISFYDSQSNRIPPFDIETDNNGSVSIPGMSIRKYYAVAESESGLKGEKELDLATNTTIFTIILLLPKGTLRLSVLNNATGSAINAFDVLRDSANITLLKTCATSPCDIDLQSRVNYSLIINSSGYYPGRIRLGNDEILPGNATSKSIRLDPIAAPPQTDIKNISLCPKLNAVFGVATLQTSCDTLVMKVDPIFPADAIPLNATIGQGDAIEFVANDPANFFNSDQLKGCFDYSSSSRGFALRYTPYNRLCPDWYQPHGNEIRSAVFRLTMKNLAGGEKKKDLMLYVWNETDLPAVMPSSEAPPLDRLKNFGLRAIDASYIPYKNPYGNLYLFTPASFYGFDTESYSSANLRTGYVLNNRQLQSQNDVLMYDGAYGPITLLDNSLYAGAASVFGYTLASSQRGRYASVKSISFAEQAYLRAYSNPIGANVYVNGLRVGTAPYSGDVVPGLVTVVMTLPYFLDYSRTQTINSGQTGVFSANLVPEGNITVISFPPGASVRLDGVFKGYAPIVLHKLASATYSVEASKTGWITSTKSVMLAQSSHQDLRFDLVAGAPMITQNPTALPSRFSATITWETNFLGDSRVNYGLSDTNLDQTSSGSGPLSYEHSVTLPNLQEGTQYYFKAISVGNSGSPYVESEIRSFRTQAVPLIVDGPVASSITDNSAVISWNTSSAGNTTIEYGLSPGSYGQMDGYAYLTSIHTRTLGSLIPGTTYYYRVTSCNSVGCDSKESQFETSSNPTPVISNLRCTDVGENSFTVRWTTDLSSNSSVKYGIGEGNFGSEQSMSGLATDHIVPLASLTKGSNYFFKAISCNNGQCSESSPLNCTTTSPVSTPAVTNLQVSNVLESSARVTFDVMPASASSVQYGTVSGAYPEVRNNSAASSQVFDLINLQLSTRYYFKAGACNSAGCAYLVEGHFDTTADMTPPVRTNALPNAMLPYGSTSVTMSLNTNEAATCRYSTTPDTAYASMTGTFTTTGGTSHSRLLGSLENGAAYNYYVRCNDTKGNFNADDMAISFSVDGTQPASGSGQMIQFNGPAGVSNFRLLMGDYDPSSFSLLIDSVSSELPIMQGCSFTGDYCMRQFFNVRLLSLQHLASESANASAFRRSHAEAGSPMKYFLPPSGEFKFSIVFLENAHVIDGVERMPLPVYVMQPIPDQCKARFGLYALTAKTADYGENWDFELRPMVVAAMQTFTTGAAVLPPDCPKPYACNLFDAYHSSPSAYPDLSSNAHCFQFEWPIVPVSSPDLRGYTYSGICSAAALAENSFCLSAPQNSSLEAATLKYRPSGGTEAQLGAYSIAAYPNYFG